MRANSLNQVTNKVYYREREVGFCVLAGLDSIMLPLLRAPLLRTASRLTTIVRRSIVSQHEYDQVCVFLSHQCF